MMHRDASTSRPIGIVFSANDDMNSVEDAYDEDATDQSIDYSKEYKEYKRNAPMQNRLSDSSRRNGTSRVSEDFDAECGADKVDPFGDYAETDLDQPTDYSLRYAEDDTDEDEKQDVEYFHGGEQEEEEDKQSAEYFQSEEQENKQNAEYFHGTEQEDTIKTYCTEDTPYETPFNFSTATSMSDLRLEDGKENMDLIKKLPKKELEVAAKVSASTFVKQADSLDSAEPDNDVLNDDATKENNPKDTAILNPGQVTPEKLVSYYEEETHGFSRANSLSSLSSTMTPQKNIPGVISKIDSSASVSKEELENDDQDVLDHNQIEPSENNSADDKQAATSNLLNKEGKMVKFGSDDYYMEETPLMFSRCSSLGSLSGFEQHSIHDDHSSVISDFSHRTSGALSPSELPDSPTQTVGDTIVLSSPRNHKTQNSEFIPKIQGEAVRPSVQHLLFSKPEVARTSVFEDAVATFEVELSPIQFSIATSLSSLTIDYENKVPEEGNEEAYGRPEQTTDVSEKDVGQLETDMLNMTLNTSESKPKEEQVSDGDEDDEDMLAACINMGMQTNRYRQSLQSLSSQKSPQSELPSILAPYQRNSVPNRLESHATSIQTSISASKTNRSAMEIVASDTVHVYCTEDTPADISPVGSQSNLSALSMPSVQEDVETVETDKPAELECHRNDSFDEGSNLSGEDEKILNECIQSGMPKARQMTPPLIKGISFVKKPEPLPHKFNIYSAPLSSPVETNHDKNLILGKSSANASQLQHLGEYSENSPNHSDDEAILTECIQSAMPKAKFNASPSMRSSMSQNVDNSKAMSVRIASPASSISFQSGYREQRKPATKKLPSFEDNVELSEEEDDIMLAQCIRSGMPKASSSMSTTTASAVKRSVPHLVDKATGTFPVSSPSYFTSKPYPGVIKNVAPHSSSLHRSTNVNPVDVHRFTRNTLSYNYFPGKSTSSATHIVNETLRNCESGARERMNNSPYYARRSSSLPSSHHIQHNQQQQQYHQQHQQQQQHQQRQQQHQQHQQHQHHQQHPEQHHRYHHHHHVESENSNTVDVCMSLRPRVKCDTSMIFNKSENYDDYAYRNPMKHHSAVPLRYTSANSLNDVGSPMMARDEWSLLELCITSGMPRKKYCVRGPKTGHENAISAGHDDCEPVPEDNYSMCSYNSCACKT